MEKILVVIDMQNDFIDGSLGTKEAQTIVPNVIKKIHASPPNMPLNINHRIFMQQWILILRIILKHRKVKIFLSSTV